MKIKGRSRTERTGRGNEERTRAKRGGRGKAVGGYLLSVAAFGLVLGLFGAGVMFFSQKAGREGADTLKNAITRASVQCYAIEGRYPPSVEYLEQNYGIQIDRKRYSVFYSGFASNVMPDITVVQQP